MAKQPVINGKAIERAYDEYLANQYVVNRRYQRKLVWSLQEKCDFIDSIINGFPVPLFLFSRGNTGDDQRYEIIDGMQRLNAIFSFIENEFPLFSNEYFDLEATALTKQLLDSKKLVQKTPVLNRESSVKISTYSLPFSIYEEDNPAVIDEVFRRINANGKHLSKQEIRQAGATGEFADLVRKIAIRIRGDASHKDLLQLSKMKEISIQQPPFTFGLDVNEIFWVKQGILSKEDLRQSMDEEIIADLIAGMVSDPISPSGANILDEYYNFHERSSRGEKLEDTIIKIGADVITEQFLVVFDEIKTVIEASGQNFPRFVLNEARPRAPRYYQILFLSFHELLIKKEMKLTNISEAVTLIDGIGKDTMKIKGGGGNWPSNKKSKLINSTVGVIESSFVQRGPSDPMYHSYTTEIENILTQSYTENTQYEFKQGFYNLHTKQYNADLLDKIFKTLSCMGNTENNAVGYVLIGIADNKVDAEKIKQEYNVEYLQVASHFITGINGEVDRYFDGDWSKHENLIRNAIQNSKLDDYYRRQVGTKVKFVKYRDLGVVIFRICSDNGPVLYDNNYYTRCAASNDPEPISMPDMMEFMKRFNKD